ncbi:MAG: 16S rRNA (cytosine(1402)-N(4))-methyltransferase RsmH [Planctomycetota bacterium]
MSIHVPVLADEVVEALAPKSGDVFIDGTLGGGGHTRLLAELVGPTGRVIGLDRDTQPVEEAERWAAGMPVAVAHANYAEAPEVLAELEIEAVNGIVLDLGLSSDQLADEQRGFSFNSTGPLDLRFDTSRGEPATRLLERLSAEHLADLIYQHGEERYSRRIARRIVERRRDQPIRTAMELAQVVRAATPRNYDNRIDPATRTFQALRIAVNDELVWLERGLKRLPECLAPGGKLAIISFHSLEDRRVKQAMRDDPRLDIITKRPIVANETEIEANPRSRSAKLRVAMRNDTPRSTDGQ